MENAETFDSIFGYAFRTPALLREALTTPSYRMDHPGEKDNQRLEFLGDAVLGLLAADRLYAELADAAEGSLTVRRTHLVSSAALCAAAVRLGLAARLRRNKGAEPLPNDAKTLADAVEAVVGAAWLDGGLPAARAVFAALALESAADEARWVRNPKGDLQIFAQGLVPMRRPVYTLVKTDGKAHEPLFTVRVGVEGVGEAEATARTRKAAEAEAAARLLARVS